MRLRHALYLFAAVLLLAASAPAVAEEEDNRFKLFNAEYNSATIQRSQTTIFLEKRLFKIDTQTGETWMLIDHMRDGKDIKFWKRITEKPD